MADDPKPVPEKLPALRPKQAAFVREYLKDFNGTQAAIRAGYSAKTAREIATENLSKPAIVAAVAAIANARLEKLNIEGDEILREALLIAKSDIGDILDFTGDVPCLKAAKDIPEHARRAIQSVKVKRYMEGAGELAKEVEVTEFKLWDKLSAIEKIGKYLGLFEDVLRVKGDPNAPIRFEFVGHKTWQIGDAESAVG